MAAANYSDVFNLAAWNAAVSLGGTPGSVKLVWGEYTGTGTAGAAHPNTLTFDGKPFQVIVYMDGTKSTANKLEMVRDLEDASSYTPIGGPFAVKVSWGGNSVSWYNEGNNKQMQYNETIRTYRYFALIGI